MYFSNYFVFNYGENQMQDIKFYNSINLPDEREKSELVDFLYNSLDEFGDPRADIEKAIDYSLQVSNSPGGFVLALNYNEELCGVLVMNKTGMDGYIPENILVYIATIKEHRGKGLGKSLMKKSFELAEGNIALHVEPDNPARYLYQNFGFKNKYLEMRLIK